MNASGVTNSSTLACLRRRLEILAHGQEIDSGRAHVVHHLVDLEPLLAEPDHDPRLGEDRRIELLDLLEQAQRGIVARARAGSSDRASARFRGCGCRRRAGRRRSPRPPPHACCGSRASGSRSSCCGVSRRSASITLTNCDAPPSGRSSRSTEVTTICSRPSLAAAIATCSGSSGSTSARHAGLDVAEGAGPGAGVAQDHHRRMLLGPAFADVRAGRFLAHRRKVELAHQPARLVIAFADRRLDPDPVGLALSAAGTGSGAFMPGQIAIWRPTCHPSPARLTGWPGKGGCDAGLWQSDRRLSPVPRQPLRKRAANAGSSSPRARRRVPSSSPAATAGPIRRPSSTPTRARSSSSATSPTWSRRSKPTAGVTAFRRRWSLA